MGGEVADVRLTGTVRAVLKALVAARGRQLPVATLARESHRSGSAVRNALAELGKAGLVQHQLVREPDRPPRLVYWPTHDGFTVGAAVGGDNG